MFFLLQDGKNEKIIASASVKISPTLKKILTRLFVRTEDKE